MKTLTWSALVAAAFVATIPLAQARDGGPGPHGRMGGGMMGERLMERYDTNGDGRVTREEVDAVQTERFAGAGDDGMSISEFEALYNREHRERMVRAFQRLDRDGDGQVTREEFDGTVDRMFSRFDRNDDGALSREDMPPRGERRGWGGHGRGDHHGWRGGDRDGDGRGWRSWWNGGPDDDADEDRGPMGGQGMMNGEGPMGGQGQGMMNGEGPMNGQGRGPMNGQGQQGGNAQ